MVLLERSSGNGDQNGEQALRERLEGSGLRLRAVERADLSTLLRFFQDSQVLPHLMGVSMDTTTGDLEKFYFGESRRHGFVSENNAGRIVATLTFVDPDPADPDSFARMSSANLVRVCVDPFLHNNRFGTRTLIKGLEEAAFNREGGNYDKVAAGIVKTPDKSYERIEHVLVRTLGFRRIGTREHEVIRTYPAEVLQDVLLVELERNEWIARRNGLIRRYFSSPQDPRGFFQRR